MHPTDLHSQFPTLGPVQVSGRVRWHALSVADLPGVIAACTSEFGLGLKTIFAEDDRAHSGDFLVRYVFGIPQEHALLGFIVHVNGDDPRVPSVAHANHVAFHYERELWTLFGIHPEGHPGLKSIILHENWPADVFPLRKDIAWNARPAIATGIYPMLKVEGEGICEVPVGPIHAGIIEPGYFRFSMLGEEILFLEPRLGWVHKGVEKLFETLPWSKKLTLAERISGDHSFHHALAYCQAVEEIANVEIPARARALRSIYAELERAANHCGDLGAIMIDTGFNFGGSQGARLRERVMQLNERLTAHRFLRGVCTYGGVTKDLSADDVRLLRDSIVDIRNDAREVLAVARESASFQNRAHGAGVLPTAVGIDHGTLGYVARAIGIDTDARRDYPYAAYEGQEITVPLYMAGDVLARFQVRADELFISLDLITRLSESLPEGLVAVDVPEKLPANRVALGIVEGWRGEIVTSVITDASGAITRVHPRDPSFHNWYAVRHSATGNVIPDFPLINKSYNQSYSGHDR